MPPSQPGEPALGGPDKAPLFAHTVPESSSQAADLPRCLGTGCDLESSSPHECDGDKWESKQLPSGDIFLFIPPDVNMRLKARYITFDPIGWPAAQLFSKSRGNVLVLTPSFILEDQYNNSDQNSCYQAILIHNRVLNIQREGAQKLMLRVCSRTPY